MRTLIYVLLVVKSLVDLLCGTVIALVSLFYLLQGNPARNAFLNFGDYLGASVGMPSQLLAVVFGVILAACGFLTIVYDKKFIIKSDLWKLLALAIVAFAIGLYFVLPIWALALQLLGVILSIALLVMSRKVMVYSKS